MLSYLMYVLYSSANGSKFERKNIRKIRKGKSGSCLIKGPQTA